MKHIKIYESWLDDRDSYDDMDYYDTNQFSKGLKKNPYTYASKRHKPSTVLPYTQKSPEEASDLIIQKIMSGGSKVPMYFRSYSTMAGSNFHKMVTRKAEGNGLRSVILFGAEYNTPDFMDKIKDNDIIMLYANDSNSKSIDDKTRKILDLARTTDNKLLILYSSKYEPNKTFIQEAGEENNILVR
jgi:hypothetical protein